MSTSPPPESGRPASGRIGVLEAGLGAGVRAFFTTRFGGASVPPYEFANLSLQSPDERARTLANLDLLAARLGGVRVNFPRQVHGPDVLVVDRRRAGRTRITRGGAPAVDGLVTRLPATPLGVRAADCMPVLMADPVHRVVGAAHAGRRGLVAGILQQTVAAMLGLGAEPDRIKAIVGPAVCGRCYEVPAEMRAQVEAQVPGTAATTAHGTPSVDLPRGAVSVLESVGVTQVEVLGICTVEDDRFYSYRRSRETGRFAGVVMLDGDDER
jgi:YfiH family protein